jgi:hypothetical protein
MSRFGTSYHVARPTGVCAASGRRLEPGSECVATLCEREEDEGFDRLDFSLEAWEGGQRPPRLFSYWKTRMPAAHEKRDLLVDDRVLLDLFERLGGDDRPQRVAFRFVLGLILMRKRLLKYVGRVGEAETERWLLEPRKGEAPGEAPPPFEVRNPHLSDEDVRELTDQLAEILQSEL